MRIGVCYEKLENARYVSHLDTVRALQRIIRRAGINMEYSKGFSPHPKLSFVTALSVGVISGREYFEVFIEDDITTDEFLQRTNAVMPSGYRFKKAFILKENDKKMAAMLESVDIIIKIYDKSIEDYACKLMDNETIELEKKTKRGMKITDIKPYIYSYSVSSDDDCVIINTQCKLTPDGGLNPRLIVKAIGNMAGKEIDDYIIDRIGVNLNKEYLERVVNF